MRNLWKASVALLVIGTAGVASAADGYVWRADRKINNAPAARVYSPQVFYSAPAASPTIAAQRPTPTVAPAAPAASSATTANVAQNQVRSTRSFSYQPSAGSQIGSSRGYNVTNPMWRADRKVRYPGL